jgi:hypothetical protein
MSWYPGKLIERLRSGTRTQLRPERLSEIAKSMSREELKEYLQKKFLRVLSDIELAIQSWLNINHTLADALLALEEIMRMHKEAGTGYEKVLIWYAAKLMTLYHRSGPTYEDWKDLISLGFPSPEERSMEAERKLDIIRIKLDHAFVDINEMFNRELRRIDQILMSGRL